MEEVHIENFNYSNGLKNSNECPEKQFNQIKNQILAYKYMIRNMNIPAEILEKIRTFEYEDWEIIREKTVGKVQDTYEKRFENHDLVLNLIFHLIKLKNL
jgi:conjugal transfer/entry exclusion protein